MDVYLFCIFITKKCTLLSNLHSVVDEVTGVLYSIRTGCILVWGELACTWDRMALAACLFCTPCTHNRIYFQCRLVEKGQPSSFSDDRGRDRISDLVSDWKSKSWNKRYTTTINIKLI